VAESSPVFRSLLVSIVVGPSKRMHVSDEVLCELLQENECKLVIFLRVAVVLIVI
jgi:hypothetical protein